MSEDDEFDAVVKGYKLICDMKDDRIHSLEAQIAELKKDVKYWKTLHINGNEFIKKLEKKGDGKCTT
jgi:hypothetical protein